MARYAPRPSGPRPRASRTPVTRLRAITPPSPPTRTSTFLAKGAGSHRPMASLFANPRALDTDSTLTSLVGAARRTQRIPARPGMPETAAPGLAARRRPTKHWRSRGVHEGHEQVLHVVSCGQDMANAPGPASAISVAW
jgi:hypothetical protein